MKKKYLALLALMLALALALSACGAGEEAASLSFSESASIERLEALDGKTVRITGYMATLSPLDGEYIYLMNMPYQSCPFCVPNTNQLANTMAVFAGKGVSFDFTARPIRVTGTLRVAERVDDYGYSYNYYIDGASYEVVDLSDVSDSYALYQSLAEDGVLSDVYAMFDYLFFVCQWTEYMSGYTDEGGNEVSYFLYPGDAELILADESENGFAEEAGEDYFPALIRRVNAVDADALSSLAQLLNDAQALAQDARAELAAGNYSYDAEQDKYQLDAGDELYARYAEIYARFSDFLAEYEL